MLKITKKEKTKVVKQPDDNCLEKLPDSLINYIALHFLDIDDIIALSQTYEKLYKDLASAIDNLKPQCLLKFIAQGEQDKAEKLIKHNPMLLIIRSPITDWTKRTFKSISPWEYTLWALDTRHMVNMILACIKMVADNKTILKLLLKQYRGVKANGVTYEFDGNVINEKHFDFNPLIQALQTYANNSNHWSSTQRKAYWITVVGMIQRSLVVHVRQQYCLPYSNHKPGGGLDFEQAIFRRHLTFWRLDNTPKSFWQSLFSKSGDYVCWDAKVASTGLGTEFAINRRDWGKYGVIKHYGAISTYHGNKLARQDAEALTLLRNVRIKDFDLIEGKLENMLANDADHTLTWRRCNMM